MIMGGVDSDVIAYQISMQTELKDVQNVSLCVDVAIGYDHWWADLPEPFGNLFSDSHEYIRKGPNHSHSCGGAIIGAKYVVTAGYQ